MAASEVKTTATFEPSVSTPAPPERMQPHTTKETRTYQTNGQWYEEVTETTVTEGKSGSRTETTTTTRPLPGPPSSPPPATEAKTPRTPSRPTSPTGTASASNAVKLPAATPTPASPTKDGDVDARFARDVLASVNEKRRLHGAQPLTLCPKLTQAAAAWARQCATQDKMAHQASSPHGQNIYRISANMPVDKSVASGSAVVEQWYGEAAKHVYGREPGGQKLETGHFTQLVWRDTRQLGVGLALSNTRRNVFVVAFFNPKGNWMGEFALQVLPRGSSPSIPTSALTTPADFPKEVLASHNKYRADHGVSPLQLSEKLNRYATEWAQKIARKDRMEHRPNNAYGENIYAKWNSKPGHTLGGEEPVASWYSEIRDHVFGKEPKSLATGHFTQLVWASSTHLGVGMARNTASGKLYVVCNYEPAGNFVGQFAAMVPRKR